MSRGGDASVERLRDRLLEAFELKQLQRAGWRRAGVSAPESVAAHCWGVAWLVLLLCPPELDRGRALAMAVLHDAGEVRAGDITPHDEVPIDAKHRAELAGLRALVPPGEAGDALIELWLDYERGDSAEGRFVKACDKLDMALQAQRYGASHGIDADEFITSALEVIDDEQLRALAGAVD